MGGDSSCTSPDHSKKQLEEVGLKEPPKETRRLRRRTAKIDPLEAIWKGLMQLNPAGRNDCFFEAVSAALTRCGHPALTGKRLRNLCASALRQHYTRTSFGWRLPWRPSILRCIADDFGVTYGEDSRKRMPWPHPYTSASRPRTASYCRGSVATIVHPGPWESH